MGPKAVALTGTKIGHLRSIAGTKKPHADLAGGAHVFQLISASCGGRCLQIGVDLGPFSGLPRHLVPACSDACGMAKGCWEPKASTATGYA